MSLYSVHAWCPPMLEGGISIPETRVIYFIPNNMWFSGMKPRSSQIAASILICWAILPDPVARNYTTASISLVAMSLK